MKIACSLRICNVFRWKSFNGQEPAASPGGDVDEGGVMRNIVFVFLFFLVHLPTVWAGNGPGENVQGRREALKALTRTMTGNGASADEVQRMVRMLDEKKFSMVSIESIGNTVSETAKAGIPIEPVIHKAYEGMAKNVPAETLVKALEKTRMRYAFAFQRARAFARSKDELKQLGVVLADCMAASVVEKDMDQITEQIRIRIKEDEESNGKNLAEQSFLLGRSMARMGVPSEKVRDVVCIALIKQYTPKDMMELQKQFSRQARTGSAAKLADEYSTAISHGARAQEMGYSGDKGYSNGSGSPGGSGISGGSGSSAGSGGSVNSGGSDRRGGSMGNGGRGGSGRN